MDVPVVASSDGGANFSTTAARFTYRNETTPPVISSYSPIYGAASGGTRLYVRGTNFAPHPDLHCDLGGVWGPATFESANLVRCLTPPAAAPEGSAMVPISVCVGNGDDATTGIHDFSPPSAVLYTYYTPAAAPVVSSLVPRYGTVSGADGGEAGGSVRVHGSNFAPVARGQLVCQWGLRPPAEATFVSSELVRCVAPPHPSGAVLVGVSNNGEASLALDLATVGDVRAGNVYTYYDPSQYASTYEGRPRICALHDAAAGAPACVVDVRGGNFAPTPGLLCRFTGGRLYNFTVGSTNATAEFQALLNVFLPPPPPPGMPPQQPPLTPPVTPPQSPDGANLTSNSSQRRLSDTSSGDAGSGDVASSEGSSGDDTSSEDTSSDDSRRSDATIGGGCDGNGTCALLVNASFISSRLVRCAAPLSVASAGDYRVHVTNDIDGRGFVDGLEGDEASYLAGVTRAPARVTYAPPAHVTFYRADVPPILTRVSPLYIHPEGSTALTLHGHNLAPTGSLRLQCAFVGVGASPPAALVVPARFDSFESVTCEAPDAPAVGVGAEMGALDVAVSIDGGVAYSAPSRVHYSPLTISHIFPVAGVTGGGSGVTVHGAAMRGVTRCRFGGERSPSNVVLHYVSTPVHVDDEQVICPSPGHPPGAIELRLSYSGVHWSAPVEYTYYEQPVLDQLRPRSGRADGGTLLRVLGFGLDVWPPVFNATDGTGGSGVSSFQNGTMRPTAYCRFGKGAHAPITPLLARTSTVFKCRTPRHPPGHVEVEITLNSHDYAFALPAAIFTFYPEPVLLDLDPTGGPIEGLTTVAIDGRGFMPTLLSERGLLNVTCRFGGAFDAAFHHTVRANVVTETQIMCVSPTTIGPNHPDGFPGLRDVSVALNGGNDGTDDDVDFVDRVASRSFVPFDAVRVAEPIQFVYYHVQIVALTPGGAPIHGGTFITLAGSGFRAFGGDCENTTAANLTAPDASDTAVAPPTPPSPACNASAAAANRTQPRCKFDFGEAYVPSTVYGSSSSGGELVCQAPASPVAGPAVVLVSLNGVDYSDFPSDDGVLGVYSIAYYHPCAISSIEPPGGPVGGGNLIQFNGGGLADFGQDVHIHYGQITPTFLPVSSMGSANGGGYTVNRKPRSQLNLTRGTRYSLEVVAMQNPFCLTLSGIGGQLAELLLVTTGPDVNPLEYGVMTFTPDASLPSTFYYQSTTIGWSTTDLSVQRINLYEPIGVSKLRFGVTPSHPLGIIRARNGSNIEATVPSQPAGTTTVGVVFSPNGAEEDYLGPLNYTYYDEVGFEYVVPQVRALPTWSSSLS